MKTEDLLPIDIRERASVDGNEYAWRMEDVKAAILAAKPLSLATLGGQTQYRLPQGTYEMYWLNFDPPEKKTIETWDEYVVRSADDAIQMFETMCNSTCFEQEGVLNIQSVRDAVNNGRMDLSQYLCFVVYFVTEDEYRDLSARAQQSRHKLQR